MTFTKNDLLQVIDTPINDFYAGTSQPKPAKRLGYVRIPGVINLSYSRLQNLHRCPRKFYLRELLDGEQIHHASVDTAFGHAWGAGIQEIFRSGNFERCVATAFAHWSVGLFEVKQKSNKSFWTVVDCLRYFYKYHYPRLAEEWELAYHNGKPCIEMFFYIHIGQGFSYQGHIDLILRKRGTKIHAVFELKSSAMDQHEANWANSEQTLGYSLLLDCLPDNDPDYEVHYLVQDTRTQTHENNFGLIHYQFGKSRNSKAEFLTDVGMQISQIQLYIEHNLFPKRGSACYSYNRPCEFFGSCDMQVHKLREVKDNSSGVYEEMTIEDCDFVVDALQMLDTQKELDTGLDSVILVPHVEPIGATSSEQIRIEDDVP